MRAAGSQRACTARGPCSTSAATPTSLCDRASPVTTARAPFFFTLLITRQLSRASTKGRASLSLRLARRCVLGLSLPLRPPCHLRTYACAAGSALCAQRHMCRLKTAPRPFFQAALHRHCSSTGGCEWRPLSRFRTPLFTSARPRNAHRRSALLCTARSRAAAPRQLPPSMAFAAYLGCRRSSSSRSR